MDIDLKELRTSKNIPARDMVEIIKKLYPKYDKTVQSKCENGSAYGVRLRQDAMDAIFTTFAPELKKAKKRDGHRLACRISCRLENYEYAELQHNIKADGYATMQDWLSDMVATYNQNKRSRMKK